MTKSKFFAAGVLLIALSITLSACMSGGPGTTSRASSATGAMSSGESSAATSVVTSVVSSAVSSTVSSVVSSSVASVVSSSAPSSVTSKVMSGTASDVMTFQQAIGLTASQIAKVDIFFITETCTTTDPQKISALMNSLKDMKLKRILPVQSVSGDGYIVSFYPKKGKGYIIYVIGGSPNIYAENGYAGPGIPGEYSPADLDGMYKILRDFFVSLGGTPVV